MLDFYIVFPQGISCVKQRSFFACLFAENFVPGTLTRWSSSREVNTWGELPVSIFTYEHGFPFPAKYMAKISTRTDIHTRPLGHSLEVEPSHVWSQDAFIPAQERSQGSPVCNMNSTRAPLWHVSPTCAHTKRISVLEIEKTESYKAEGNLLCVFPCSGSAWASALC